MLFDTSVRKELARTFGATLVVLLTIVLTMMLIRTLGLAAKGGVAAQDVVLVLVYTSLGYLPTLLALSLFVAIVISLGRMYRDSEMAIWFSSGIGLMRFVQPILRMSAPVLVLVGLMSLTVWPWVNEQINDLRQRYAQRSNLARVSPGSFQSSEDGTRVFFIERAGDLAEGSRNVFLLMRDARSESVTTASAGRVVEEDGQRLLKLDTGQRNEVNQRNGEHTRLKFEHLSVMVTPAQARAERERPPKATPTLELLERTDTRSQGELVWRVGTALSALNMVLLGIGTAASHPRRASNWSLLFALLGFVIYLNLLNLSQAWVASGRLGAAPALLGLHGGVFLLAWALIHWRGQTGGAGGPGAWLRRWRTALTGRATA
ncbi:LPS export ABC transporter permease LptF [Vitreoscilla filiformis]|uniref:LPS export ABC transporter permease LptF n=1 Tax=Vitreoscilla filiformis TaxID=63 RepID=UPI000B7AABE0|nr:LPS export ABC transporter permease LptF [Vitreoscilla filiformis]